MNDTPCHDCGLVDCACDLHCDFCGFPFEDDHCQPNNPPKEPATVTTNPKKPKPTKPTTKETTMPTQPEPIDTEAETAAALEAISDTGAPRHLHPFDAAAWHDARTIVEAWTTDGEITHSVSLEAIISEQRSMMPTLPGVKVAARAKKALAQLAFDADLTLGRVQLPQTGDLGTDPVLAFVALPETTRAFQKGYTVAVIVLWPQDTYTYPDTGEVVFGLYRSQPSGIARYYVDADRAESDRAELAAACRTLRRLAANPDTIEAEDDPYYNARAVKSAVI